MFINYKWFYALKLWVIAICFFLSWGPLAWTYSFKSLQNKFFLASQAILESMQFYTGVAWPEKIGLLLFSNKRNGALIFLYPNNSFAWRGMWIASYFRNPAYCSLFSCHVVTSAARNFLNVCLMYVRCLRFASGKCRCGTWRQFNTAVMKSRDVTASDHIFRVEGRTVQ